MKILQTVSVENVVLFNQKKKIYSLTIRLVLYLSNR